MYYIFLDVDGVLNQSSTKEKLRAPSMPIASFKGIDPRNLEIFAELVATLKSKYHNISVVLSSSWRYDTDREGNRADNVFRNELVKQLARIRVTLDADTPIISNSRRGLEIATYLASLDELPEGYVVLDDMVFADFSALHVMRHLVQTDYYRGLTEKHIRIADRILSSGLTDKERSFIETMRQRRSASQDRKDND